VTAAEHSDSGLDFDQAVFAWGQGNVTGEKEAGQGLQMAAAEETPRNESRCFGLQGRHDLILNGE
jgi:hypothetical protein